MKIRERLSPSQQRLISALAVVVALALWFALTMPLLPPLPEPSSAPHEYSAQLDQSERDTHKPDDEQAAGTEAEPTQPAEEPEELTTPSRRPLVPGYILPSPVAVLKSLAYLHTEEALVRSAAFSLWRI